MQCRIAVFGCVYIVTSTYLLLETSIVWCCASGADGADHPAEGGRPWAEHQGGRRAQAAHSHLKNIQGSGRGPDRATVCRRRCY